jgi:hypothetical protein
MALKFKSHPGSGYIKVTCDVCGGKFYRKDTVLVKDKYNYQHGLVVCLSDLDQTNEQNLPNRIRETQVPGAEMIRAERPDSFVLSGLDDTLPSVPRLLTAELGVLEDVVTLAWQAPEIIGSSGITGYTIKRDGNVIATNTGNGATTYEDSSAVATNSYTYSVAAVNSFGTGAYTPTITY